MSEDDWTTCEVCGEGINVTRGGAMSEAMLYAWVALHLKKHKVAAPSVSAGPSL